MNVATRNIIVIGASAGGFGVIREIVAGLPANLNASIFIVWHISPDVRGVLPQVLNQNCKLIAEHGVDEQVFKPGHIYVAPPDHHLLIEGDKMRLSHGPKENRFRPAIDPLFRSAAYYHGSRVIGVVLSGALDDGTTGLWTIKQYGGAAIVQDPSEAEVGSMPRSALEAVNVDRVLRGSEIASALVGLVSEELPDVQRQHADDEKVKMEIDIAMELNEKYNVLNEGQLTPYTCPECHGVLVSLTEGGRLRFRCHTGHAFSADSLLASVTENIEHSLWAAIRSIQESVFLLNHMGDHFAEANQPKVAAIFFRKAREAEKRITVMRQAVFNHELFSTDILKSQAADPQAFEEEKD
jgi:two-component system chemotaxis response regulator CheB